MQGMYYIGLDVHKRTISYCVKDVSGRTLEQRERFCTRAPPQRVGRDFALLTRTYHGSRVFGNWPEPYR
jgi:hypothetical protein